MPPVSFLPTKPGASSSVPSHSACISTATSSTSASHSHSPSSPSPSLKITNGNNSPSSRLVFQKSRQSRRSVPGQQRQLNNKEEQYVGSKLTPVDPTLFYSASSSSSSSRLKPTSHSGSRSPLRSRTNTFDRSGSGSDSPIGMGWAERPSKKRRVDYLAVGYGDQNGGNGEAALDAYSKSPAEGGSMQEQNKKTSKNTNTEEENAMMLSLLAGLEEEPTLFLDAEDGLEGEEEQVAERARRLGTMEDLDTGTERGKERRSSSATLVKKGQINKLLQGLQGEFGVETWDADDQAEGGVDSLKSESNNKPKVELSNQIQVQGQHASPVSKSELPSIPSHPCRSPMKHEKVGPHPGVTQGGMVVDVKSEENMVQKEEEFDEFTDLDFPFDDFDFDLSSSPSKASPSKTVAKYPILNPSIPRMAKLDLKSGVKTAAEASSNPQVDGQFRSTTYARCRVMEVNEGETKTWGWGEKLVTARVEKLVVNPTTTVEGLRTGFQLELTLKDEYSTLDITEGDIVNVISPELDNFEHLQNSQTLTSPPAPGNNAVHQLTISMKSQHTHLIHHPDILLPMTTIANGLTCRRRPLISGLIRGGSPVPTKPLLYGNILHELLQAALSLRSFGTSSLKKHLDEILLQPRMQMDIWAAGLGMQDVREEVWMKAEQAIVGFGTKWVGAHPKSMATIHNSKSTLAISGLHDIEESIWSPKWGMKGKVDASVDATILDMNPKPTTGAPVPRVSEMPHPMPFEIKTGRSVGVLEHRAQTMLYTFLMEERYKTPVPAGLLYYTQTDAMIRVPAIKNEVRGLLQTRNELAGYLSRELGSRNPEVEDLTVLPATIDSYRDCRSCYQVDGCMLYRKAVDKVPITDDDPLAELYASKTGHMEVQDVDFFSRWEHLISLEEKDMFRFKHQLWTMTATEREKTGRCFANMVITKHVDVRGVSTAKIHQHSYTFARKTNDSNEVPLLNGHIGKGDPVSLTIEPDLISIARGFVVEISPREVVIGTNLEIDVEALLRRSRVDEADPEAVAFRIDKDEMISGTSRMRDNLARLFFNKEAGGDFKRRSLIVDLVEPVFEEWNGPDDHEIPSHLNTDQRAAMRKVMTAKDFALILGMPGTGKTTTIAEIILALVARGKSVLLTSYTHSAVDTILMKLVNSGQKILRLGNADKVHPDISHLTLDARSDTSTLSELEARLMEPQIVATTCLSIDHPIFARRTFDYCIVDEASQITLPTCIGPLRFADTFVLVGDHFQLPPIVKNGAARRGGLDVSLFRLLSDEHPESVVDLTYQYRMNEDIMSISNKLVYGERLKCGSEEIAKQGLVLPTTIREAVEGHCMDQRCWIDDLAQEQIKAVFVDTDGVPAAESKVGDLVQNVVEAELAQQLAFALIRSGIKQEDIAIITPYRQQIKVISNRVSEYPGLEVLTADKSQGRDKDVIILSMVRSNDHGGVGELIRDWRRNNVSFTRAKKKLVIFGSRTTLQRDRLLAEFFDLMVEKGWVYRLEAGSHLIHSEVLKPVVKVKGVKEKYVKEKKKPTLGDKMLASRPFLREALGNITNQ